MTSPRQVPGALKSSLSPHRFLSTQVGSAIISSEVWDETGEANTAVTFHLQHWAQVLRDASEKQPPGTVILVWCPPLHPIICSLDNQGLKCSRKILIHKPSHCPLERGKGSNALNTYFMAGALNKQHSFNLPAAHSTKVSLEEVLCLAPAYKWQSWDFIIGLHDLKNWWFPSDNTGRYERPALQYAS